MLALKQCWRRGRGLAPRVDPLLEREMTAQRRRFVPNDVLLSALTSVQLVLGPNCSGKSTLLRQVGVACVLAQCGCFVPAAVDAAARAEA